MNEYKDKIAKILEAKKKAYRNVLANNMSMIPVTVNNASAISTATAGFEQTISTITDIAQGVIRQKFYKLQGQTPSDFVPIDVSGFGAYSSQIFQYRAAYVGSPFQAGLVAPSTGLGKNATADIVVDGITIKNNFWRMQYEVSNEQIRMAEKDRSVFNLIEEKEKARKTVWDLGIQEVTFNGLGDGVTFGLLNQPTITKDTSLFPVALTKMTMTQLRTFMSTLMGVYLDHSNGTEMFDTWCMPTNEFYGLGTYISDSYPQQTYRDAINKIFDEAGRKVKIVHSIYNQTAGDGGKGRHVFYRHDPDSVRMYIPKSYTPHPLYPINGMDSVSVAEGQFTGVKVLRENEFLYADEQA